MHTIFHQTFLTDTHEAEEMADVGDDDGEKWKTPSLEVLLLTRQSQCRTKASFLANQKYAVKQKCISDSTSVPAMLNMAVSMASGEFIMVNEKTLRF